MATYPMIKMMKWKVEIGEDWDILKDIIKTCYNIGDNKTIELFNYIVVPRDIEPYKVYPQRWWIVVCVALVYGGNYCHWIAIPSVGKIVAQYYEQSGK